MLSHSELQRLLRYDPATGLFTWRKLTGNLTQSEKRRNAIFAGRVAGSVHKRGYIHVKLCNRGYKAHRLAWFYIRGEWPKNEIDHINHDPADNRIVNLRDVTRVENMRNQRLSRVNSSGTCGVTWCNRDKVWLAYYYRNKQRIHLGGFKQKHDAIKARREADKITGFHQNHGH